MSPTPGPWTMKYESFMDDGDKHFVGIVDAKGDKIVTRGVAIAMGGYGDDEPMDNARLIAAAPDLLAALQEFYHWVGPDLFHEADVYQDRARKSCEAARAAIAKATGVQS